MKSSGYQSYASAAPTQLVPHPIKAAVFSFILIVSIFAITLPIHSQDTITARVNKSKFSTDELIILTLTVVNDSPQQPRPLLPRLDGLAVIDLDLTTNVSSANGTIYTEVVFTYRLQPRRTGVLTIPAIPVEIGDQVIEAQPLSIEVTQGQAPLPLAGNEVNPDQIIPPVDLKGQDFFIESQVDIQTPYIHQQLIHTFRFYQAIQLYKEPKYDEPLFTGFETIGLPVRQYNLDVEGRTYLITEIRTMLFPKNVGQITIRPARLVLLGNFYEDPVEMYTEALTIEVQSLPNNAPPNFNGAVGQYEVKAWFSPSVAVVNQPSTLYVAVSGVGNMNLLPEPTWPETNWWRTYDSLSSLTTDVTEDKLMTGTRVFERLVIPGQVGEYSVPPVRVVYFDPIAAAYRTISTDPISVEIIPAPTPEPVTPTPLPEPIATPVAIAADTNAASASEVDSTEDVTRVLIDSTEPRPLFGQLPLFPLILLGLCSLLPLAAAAGAGGLWVWQQRQKRDQPTATIETPPPDDELHQPSQNIHPVLAATMRHSGDNYRTIHQALTTYLGQFLQKPVHGLTRSQLLSQLRQHRLDEALIAEIEDCLAQCETQRYGPSAKDAGWSLMATADALLFKLDEVTKPKA